MSINDHFKLPIFYNNKKMQLKENIINDLEMIKTVDMSSNSNYIYDYMFGENANCFSKKLLPEISNTYTTDIAFLKDSQKLLKKYKKNENDTIYKYDYDNINNIWDEIKNDNGFKEKYQYVDWSMWEFLNKSEVFLQFMSLYNIVSPVISFFVPIIILIIPFFIIQMKGIQVTMSEYLEILKVIISQHAIGKLFTDFNSAAIDQKIYLIVSAAFYTFSIYQNVLTCIRFHENMKKIHNYLFLIKEYLNHTTFNMENLLLYTKNLKTFSDFNVVLERNHHYLNEIKYKLEKVNEYKWNSKKFSQIGYTLKYFYELYDNEEYNNAFLYSFGFNGYLDCIHGIQNNIQQKNIGFASFTKKIKSNKFINNYYPVLINKNPTKNNVNLNKNIIVTGPNASGKTTILKSVTINIILTQQFGCGFYDIAHFCPYKHIHCYLNIPDTSGRDSLFQAEARRCKDIIQSIQNGGTHFCIFDELYSGTNPEEAIISASAFMEYINGFNKVSSMLTTHFIEVCKNLDKKENVINYHMETINKNNNLMYTYHLKKGISETKGGMKILYDMNYPKEILEKHL